jgi:transposase-like protein
LPAVETRDFTEHLAEVYGASVSAATISRVTRGGVYTTVEN